MRAPRAAAPFLAALAVAVAAWPAAGQSPSASPLPTPAATPGFVAAPVEPDRPMLAPAGWLLTAVEGRVGGRDTVTVLATAPSGKQRRVATLDDVTQAAAGEPTNGRVRAVLPATVDGILPVVVETNGTDEGTAIHLFDLAATDPQAPVFAGWASGLLWAPAEAATSGPDGRVSWETQRPDGDDATVLLDPLVGRLTELRDPPSIEWFGRSQDWLASGAGWPATRDEQSGILTTAGTFRPTSVPHPLVDLARGARQVSVQGRFLGHPDTGTQGTTGPATGCRQVWTATADPSVRPTVVWWNRCRDAGRLLDIRWDVDGEGVLALVDRKGRGIQLIRRDTPGAETVLATITDKKVARARDRSRQVEVLGLAPGPRPDELLLALRPVDHFGSIFFLSTVEGVVHEVPGTFAGFVEPPIDRDVTGQPSLIERPPTTPEGLVAPTDWLLAWIVGPEATDGARSLRIVALAPDGAAQEVATLPGLLDADHQMVEAALSAMRVTNEGYLPIPLGPDPEAEQPSEIRVIDLHDPTAEPLILADTPDRRFDWTTLRSSGSGRLSVRLLDEPTFVEIALPGGAESLVTFSADLAVDPEPVRASDGWPAVEGTQAGVLQRLNGVFTPYRPRLVALSRGAEQVHRDGLGLWVVFPGALEPGSRRQGCAEPEIRSGTADRTGLRWWSPCRETGRRLDIRWDTDGDGALVLVQRGANVQLLRESRPGRFRLVGRFPAASVGGRVAVRSGLGVDALMVGQDPRELILALSTPDGLWRWSTLERRPVALPLAPGEIAGFAGFSVPEGDPR